MFYFYIYLFELVYLVLVYNLAFTCIFLFYLPHCFCILKCQVAAVTLYSSPLGFIKCSIYLQKIMSVVTWDRNELLSCIYLFDVLDEQMNISLAIIQ